MAHGNLEQFHTCVSVGHGKQRMLQNANFVDRNLENHTTHFIDEGGISKVHYLLLL